MHYNQNVVDCAEKRVTLLKPANTICMLCTIAFISHTDDGGNQLRPELTNTTGGETNNRLVTA